MANEAETEKQDAQPKSKKKLIVIAAVIVALLGGAGAYWFFIASKPKHNPEAEKKITSFVDLKEMIIGLQPDRNDQSERQRLMKVKISLEVADAKFVPVIQPLMPRIEDVFQTYLRELRPADVQGSAGLLYLKEELLRRVNMAVAPSKVEAVLFKEIALQ